MTSAQAAHTRTHGAANQQQTPCICKRLSRSYVACAADEIAADVAKEAGGSDGAAAPAKEGEVLTEGAVLLTGATGAHTSRFLLLLPTVCPPLKQRLCTKLPCHLHNDH